jgi:hypothetical protein
MSTTRQRLWGVEISAAGQYDINLQKRVKPESSAGEVSSMNYKSNRSMPDSAMETEVVSQARSFRRQDNVFLPQSRRQRAVPVVATLANEGASRAPKRTLQLNAGVSLLPQGRPSLISTAESGLKRRYAQLRTDLSAAQGMVALVAGLREFFREPVTVQRALREIHRELEIREQRFLDMAQTQVYGRATSPYLKLLKWSGCEFSDLQAAVRQRGLEKTLEKLAAEGVYLTSDEFKGKKEVVRTGGSFRISAADVRLKDENRGLILNQSSGSSGQAQRYALSTAGIAESSLLRRIFLEAHGLSNHALAVFDAIMPSSGGIRHLLGFAKCGIDVQRWFARRIPVTSLPEAIFHRVTTTLIVLAAKSFGPGGPWPEFLDNHEVGKIVDWMAEQREAGKPCCLRSTVSNAVKVARAAQAAGQSLSGATLIVSGEPLTESKRALIEQAGGRTIPCYGCAGLGEIGYGCGNPAVTDDFHVPINRLAVIEHPTALDIQGTAIHPFLFSTLSPLAARLHINVENGDYGTLEERQCGCSLQGAGLALHLKHIRSFEKLTSEGMSYFFADLVPLIENGFPSEFGGGPGDYQLAEEEDGKGQTRLTLIVHPEVERLNEEKILARLRDAFANGSRTNRFMAWVWQDAGTFRVKRAIPHTSARGKILPVHIKH